MNFKRENLIILLVIFFIFLVNQCSIDNPLATNTTRSAIRIKAADFIITDLKNPVTEDGKEQNFSVQLKSEPTEKVFVTLSLNDEDKTEAKLATESVEFNSLNWNSPQEIQVTGVDDFSVDGDMPFFINFASTSIDEAYNGKTATVKGTCLDNDTAGVYVSKITNDTSESGETASFTLTLKTQPSKDVVVRFHTDSEKEIKLSSTDITFTQENWNASQAVSLTGLDDKIADGDSTFKIIFDEIQSEDINYVYKVTGSETEDPNSLTDIAADGKSVKKASPFIIAYLTGKNIDNDSIGIKISDVTGQTSEEGDKAEFTVSLASEPKAIVNIDLKSSDINEATINKESLTFDSQNWSSEQKIIITGVDDLIKDGNKKYQIIFDKFVSTDSAYASLKNDPLSLTNTDNETEGFVISEPVGGMALSETGAEKNFSIKLTSKPLYDVAVNMIISDETEAQFKDENDNLSTFYSVLFTKDDWDTEQTITVIGVDDFAKDGTQSYFINFLPTASIDPIYAAIKPNQITATTTDDDTPALIISNISGDTTEAGGIAFFTVALQTAPKAGASVSIDFTSSKINEGTVTSGSLTFSQTDWNIPQTVTVTGVDDNMKDGNQSYVITLATSSILDSDYNALSNRTINVTNIDNDTAYVIIGPISGVTTESLGTATFQVSLQSEPIADVVILMASSDTAEGDISLPVSKQLTFTSTNWNTPQTVTLSGTDDQIADGNKNYIISFSATSTDINYNALSVTSLTVTNTDNDHQGITVSPISGHTTENLGAATFTVVLNSQPTTNVDLSFSSSDITEGTVSPANITFTDGNWSTPQTITVTGVDDLLVDGTISYQIIFGAAVSSDQAYNGLTPQSINVSNTDND